MKWNDANRDLRPAVAFLLPNLLGFLLFTAGPVAVSLYLSFTSWDALSRPHWIGLANFTALFGFHGTPQGWQANDPEFWQYLGNTLFMLLALPLNIVGSLVLALALNQKLRFTAAYRLVYFLPSILYGAAIFYLWKYMFEPNYGLFNALLARLDLPGPGWLQNPALAKPSLIFMTLWMKVGGLSMVVYLAALQGVAEELHEAARIDGANRWQQFWHVTWPALRPATFFIVTIELIYGLQSGFDTAYIMTDGGPYGSTTTLGYYVYLKAFRFFELGYASAIAWVIFFITLAVTLVNWRRGGSEGA
jgi:multiple sugar transport system permease protein